MKTHAPETPLQAPAVFEGRVIDPDEIERIHKQVLEFERAGWP